MLTPVDHRRMAEVCCSISNQCADDSGFVPIRNLLRRFKAQLILRPLLVEGMLAKLATESGNELERWAVLVDSERWQQSNDDIELETSRRPLPSRLRNTIAHELVHSLAFRYSEFGIELQHAPKDKQSNAALVKSIEDDTERFSPLLLCSDRALGNLLKNANQVVSIDDFTQARRAMGLSRYVLVNRLNLLRSNDEKDFLGTHELRDLALGIAEWSANGEAIIKSWPLFSNFDRGVAPDFVHRIQRENNPPAKSIFADPSFLYHGGSGASIKFVATTGSGSFEVECSSESVEQTAGRTFLFTVHRTNSYFRSATQIEVTRK